MWAELYNLGEDGIEAIATLQELNICHLARLVMTKYVDFYFNNLIFHTIDMVGDYSKEQSCTKLETMRDFNYSTKGKKGIPTSICLGKKIVACLVDA